MPRLRVLTSCSGTSWVPGQLVDATAEQAQQHLGDGCAELIRGSALEQASAYDPRDREERRRAVRPR